MKKTTTFCDYCGKQINEREGEFELNIKQEEGKPFGRLKLDDLCAECTKKIHDAIVNKKI